MMITTITASNNSVMTLTQSLQSATLQKGSVEHIIIDGGSTDGTCEILNKYHSDTLKVISEPDRGPYDAMNKGIKMATGNIIGILNADDYYPEPDVLETVMRYMEQSRADSCYADLEYVDRDDTNKVVRKWVSGPYDPRSWYRGWMMPHPTFFVRREVYEKYGLYRLDMGTSADYELMLRFCVKHRISTVYIPRVLVRMRTGGLSNVSLKNRARAHLMDYQAWRVNGLRPKIWTVPFKPLRKIPQWFK